MAISNSKSSRLWAVVFVLSLPLSYFSLWVGAISQTGSISDWVGLMEAFRLACYAIIMTLGMLLSRRVFFGKGTSILKVVLAAILTPFLCFLVMSAFDVILYSTLDGQPSLIYLPVRMFFYMMRFYIVGMIATLVAGLFYNMSVQEASQRATATHYA